MKMPSKRFENAMKAFSKCFQPDLKALLLWLWRRFYYSFKMFLLCLHNGSIMPLLCFYYIISIYIANHL